MFKITLLIALISFPGISFSNSYSESSFIGLWCLTEMKEMEDDPKEFLDLKFMEGGKLEYRMNPRSSEFQVGTFALSGETLDLKERQGLSFRKFKLSSVSSDKFTGRYFVEHTFTRGACK